MKHTPGPWTVYRADNFGRADATGEAVAVAGIVIGAWGVSEDMANARLIAEAPAMHAELKAVNSILDVLMGNGVYEARVRIASLLARIDGTPFEKLKGALPAEESDEDFNEALSKLRES